MGKLNSHQSIIYSVLTHYLAARYTSFNWTNSVDKSSPKRTLSLTFHKINQENRKTKKNILKIGRNNNQKKNYNQKNRKIEKKNIKKISVSLLSFKSIV